MTPFRVAVLVVSLVAFGFGVRKATAALSETQPFTAVETQITRAVNWPVPYVATQILAVSGDGQLIAQLSSSNLPAGRPVYGRTVWNKKERTKIRIDPEFKMLIVHPYHEPFYLNGGDFILEDGHMTAGPDCEGTPNGQIEGFDVYRTEPIVEDSSNPGGTTTWKRWAAPKLG